MTRNKHHERIIMNLRVTRKLVVSGLTATALLAGAPAALAATSSAGPSAAPASARSAADVATANVTIHVNADEPFSGTGCTHGTFGNSLVCLYVNGTGLHVNYATVTNDDAPTGEVEISDTYDGRTYYGPDNFGHGEAWRHNFSLSMKNQDKVCGSVSGLDVACITIVG
jgi:hypothetical protein